MSGVSLVFGLLNWYLCLLSLNAPEPRLEQAKLPDLQTKYKKDTDRHLTRNDFIGLLSLNL